MQQEQRAQLRAWWASLRLLERRFVYVVMLSAARAPRGRAWTRSCERVESLAAAANQLGNNVYYCALLRDGMSSDASAVTARDAIFADMDLGPGSHESIDDALATVRNFGAVPTTIVASGSGLHVRFQLDRDLPHAMWEMLQAAVNRALRGDKAAMDVARVHRIPGTFNYKSSPPRPVVLIEANPATTVEAITAALEGAGHPLSAAKEARPLAKPVIGARAHSGRPFDLANDVPVREVLRFLGVETFYDEGARTFCGCPVCPGPDDHELVVGGRSNVATCFGDCRRTFTAVDLVVAVRGVTPREAVDQLAEHFGFVGFPRRSSGGRQ